MATIRGDEPAKGLRKENREISAKMKEDEQMQKDTDAEKRTEATETEAQPPKKKNIIQKSFLCCFCMRTFIVRL